MKELITQALNEAYVLFEKRIPKTKIEIKQVSISNVEPVDLKDFMEVNNIPSDAYFGNINEGYDECGDVCLNYEINIPVTEKDTLRFKKEKFTGVAWNFIYRALTTNGYKRVGFNPWWLKQFDDTTVYDMYINKEFDRLCEYYSLAFNKN